MDDNTGDGVISTGKRKTQPLYNKNLDCDKEDKVTLRSKLLFGLKERNHSKYRQLIFKPMLYLMRVFKISWQIL